MSRGQPGPLREDEPQAVAKAAARMGLRHVVVTSVTRDDLPDGGAAAFAATINAIRHELPHATIEVLTSDFADSPDALRTVLAARPDVFNHNVETVPRLYQIVRPQAHYARSLDVLRQAAAFLAGETPARRAAGTAATPGPIVKSGLMVGLGETDDEVLAVLRDLRGAGCQLVTIGQYLSPSPNHLPVHRYVEPAQFEQWRRQGLDMGFKAVMAGPFVRSSYHAAEMIEGREEGEQQNVEQ
jgi:lipoic acid synthetase